MTMAAAKPQRTRQRNLVVRLNDYERDMLDVVAEHLHLPSASEAFRHLVRRAYEEVPRALAGSLSGEGPGSSGRSSKS
jgi:hypothetical protein